MEHSDDVIIVGLSIGLQRIWFRALRVLVDADNVASRRVAIGNGFREVGMQDGRVCYIFESTEQMPA